MKVIKCGCRHCRRGLRTVRESKRATLKIRAARRAARQALKQGKEPEKRVSLGYTD